MASEAMKGLVDELLSISPECADRAELGRAVALNAKLQAFASHYAMRCSRRGDELARQGQSENGFALLIDGNGSARDARAAGERDRVCGDLPTFDDALAAGEVSAEHLDVLARHTKDLSDEQRTELAAAAEDLMAAANNSAWLFDRQAKTIIDTIKAKTRPDSDVEELARQRAASNLKRWTDKPTGMKMTLIALDPLRDAQLHAVIDAKIAQLKQDTANADVPFAQLQVMAVLESVTGEAGEMGVAEINIFVDANTVCDGRHDRSVCETIDGTMVPITTMHRFCCDAVVNAVLIEPDGTVRRLAETRSPNRAQRRALAAMYATCAHPACTVPVSRCKNHHIVWYSERGPTLLDNLVPLCEQHHHLVHEGGWTLTMTPDREITWHRPDGTIWKTHHSRNRHPDPRHPQRRQRRAA